MPSVGAFKARLALDLNPDADGKRPEELVDGFSASPLPVALLIARLPFALGCGASMAFAAVTRFPPSLLLSFSSLTSLHETAVSKAAQSQVQLSKDVPKVPHHPQW